MSGQQPATVIDVAALEAATAKAVSKAAAMREEIRSGKATTGDIIRDFVYCNFHTLDGGKEKLYRRLAELFAQHAGKFVMVRSSKFVQTHFPLVPDGSEHRGITVQTMHLGIITDEQPLISRDPDGKLEWGIPVKNPLQVYAWGEGNNHDTPVNDYAWMHDPIIVEEENLAHLDTLTSRPCFLIGDAMIIRWLNSPEGEYYWERLMHMANALQRPLYTVPAFSDFCRERVAILTDSIKRHAECIADLEKKAVDTLRMVANNADLHPAKKFNREYRDACDNLAGFFQNFTLLVATDQEIPPEIMDICRRLGIARSHRLPK